MNKHLKILIADDSTMDRAILHDHLASWGYQVYEAVNGQEVMEIVDTLRPDLVILDGVMPEMDGYAVCAHLQKKRKIPVILITAYDKNDAVAKAFAVGAEEYLTKPIYWDVLKYKLQRIFRARKAEIALRKSEEKLQGILANAVAGISMIDDKGQYIYANQKMADMLGYSIAELYQLNLTDVTYREDWPLAQEHMGEIIKKELNEYHMEKRYVRKDKTVFWGRLSASVVYDDAKKIECIVGVIVDITNRKLMDAQIKLQNKYLLALNEVSLQLLNRLDLDDVLTMIVKFASELFDKASGSLYLLQENSSEVKLEFAVGIEEKNIGITHSKDEGLIGEVFATGKPVIVDDYQEWKGRIKSPAFDYLGLVIGLPVISSKKVIGVCVILSEEGWMFSDEEKFLLTRFAGLASIAYDNAFLYRQAQEEIVERKMVEEKLRYMSLHDSLTGLYNRTYFAEEMNRIASGHCLSVGIIVIDIDGLKTVNDTLGHAFGDALIIAAGAVLKKACRRSDIIARIGGDEFVILLPEAEEDRVVEICQRIEKQMPCYQVSLERKCLSLSIGWAFSNSKSMDIEELFKEADENMYRDKLVRKSQ